MAPPEDFDPLLRPLRYAPSIPAVLGFLVRFDNGHAAGQPEFASAILDP